MELMKQELEVLETLDNQNIVRILQILESSDKIYIVMELARYGQLESFFEKDENEDGLKEDVIVHILRQIITSLKYLHDTKNIVHRDLKPENILISDKDFSKNRVYIMLTDFGFACQENKQGDDSLEIGELGG